MSAAGEAHWCASAGGQLPYPVDVCASLHQLLSRLQLAITGSNLKGALHQPDWCQCWLAVCWELPGPASYLVAHDGGVWVRALQYPGCFVGIAMLCRLLQVIILRGSGGMHPNVQPCTRTWTEDLSLLVDTAELPS